MDNTYLKAMFKEILRLLVFSLPGAGILYFTNSPEAAGTYGLPILYILRSIDKGLHETSDDLIETGRPRGLVPF